MRPLIAILILSLALFACRKESKIPVRGCTYPNALNYNADATVDDGTCIFDTLGGGNGGNGTGTDTIYGCMDTSAVNYNPLATIDDGSCVILGCTDSTADNYNPLANQDDGSCIISGCTDPKAENYDPNANNDDGSCIDIREKFVGSWIVTSDCSPPFFPGDPQDITYNSAVEDTIEIANFTAGGGMVFGLVNKDALNIPSQTAGFFLTVDGSGSINGARDQITITINWDAGFLGSGTCTATYTL